MLKKESALPGLILPLVRAHRYKLLVAIMAIPVSSVMAMLLPYLTKVAIDDYIVPAAESGALESVLGPLARLVALAMGVVAGGYLADAAYVSMMQRAGQSMISDLREVVYQRTLRLPRKYFDTHPIGTVLTRVTSDIEALGESLATGALSLVVDLLKALAYLGMMFALNWRLTMVLLLILPLLIVLVVFFQRRVRSTFFVARQALSEATGFLQECLSGIKTIQLYSGERLVQERFMAKNARFLKAQNYSNFYDALLFSLVEGITLLSLAMILWYSAGELLSGFLTLGVLVAFMEYIQRLLVPVREFTQQMAVMQRAMAALDHIDEICMVPLDEAEREEAPPELQTPASAAPGDIWQASAAISPPIESDGPPFGSAAQPPPGRLPFRSLEFRDVRFRYGVDGPEILKGISFSVYNGQTLAVVGATGSGKSTLIRLLTRAYGGYEGSIRIDGEELSNIPAGWLSGLISVVHQNVFLFQGTVAFNISLGRSEMDRERIEQAARYVNAHTFIGQLKGGFDFEVLQGGANLSAGQAQLIALARAVAAETELIIFDEATSSVDSVTENLIQQTVNRLYQDKTVIAIAHRLSTIRNADTILVMETGEIAETGSHAQLMAHGGIYATLVGKIEQEQEGGEGG